MVNFGGEKNKHINPWLDAVFREVSNECETSAILIFWKDFCSDPVCKQTVKQILNGETIEPNQHLYRLEEHGFIVEQNGRWQNACAAVGLPTGLFNAMTASLVKNRQS